MKKREGAAREEALRDMAAADELARVLANMIAKVEMATDVKGMTRFQVLCTTPTCPLCTHPSSSGAVCKSC